MEVYLINIFFILIWGIIFIYFQPIKKKKKYFYIISSLQWIFISGLRDSSVGADTYGYMKRFEGMDRYSWELLLKVFKDNYFHKKSLMTFEEKFLYKDTGYAIFEKIIHLFTNNSQIYLFIVAIIIFSSLAYFIYNNSTDPVFSYILFSTLFYSFYAITGIRQSLATALIVFIGTEYIKKKKLLNFLIISLIAYTLHKSAILFVPFYFLAHVEITKKYLIFLWGTSFVFFKLGSNFILTLANKIGYEREEVFRADTSRYTIIIIIIGIVVSIFSQRIQKVSKEKRIELNATLLTSVITILTLIDQSVMRVQQYYALFLMFSIPSVLNCFNKRSLSILRILCIGILILYLIKNNPQYMFF